jgi:RNA polymerase subunit RPABC4/transcription elongation factor Spt4
MTIAFAAVVLFGKLLDGVFPSPLDTLARLLWILSAAGYWVMAAWWVYLDASWRRMDAVPWGILILLTNLFGLVTYLVIRYPDPKTCGKCGAYLKLGLKRCPYCGSETEPTCPRCQSPIQADWVFCPACSAQIPDFMSRLESEFATTDISPSLSIRGTVIDAVTGTPIEYAEVKIDSRNGRRAAGTDPFGRFAFSDLDPKPYVLLASAPGYSTEAKPYTPDPTSAAQVHFSLYPKVGTCG